MALPFPSNRCGSQGERIWGIMWELVQTDCIESVFEDIGEPVPWFSTVSSLWSKSLTAVEAERMDFGNTAPPFLQCISVPHASQHSLWIIYPTPAEGPDFASEYLCDSGCRSAFKPAIGGKSVDFPPFSPWTRTKWRRVFSTTASRLLYLLQDSTVHVGEVPEFLIEGDMFLLLLCALFLLLTRFRILWTFAPLFPCPHWQHRWPGVHASNATID